MRAPSMSRRAPELRSVDLALCAGLTEHASLDLEELQRRLSDALPGAQIGVAGDLCARPRRIAELANGARSGRLVLGLCRGDYERRGVQAAIRKSDLDVFAIEEVSISRSEVAPSPREIEEIVLRFRAAAARLAVFPGSSPEHVRLKLLPHGARLSRRSLFTLPPLSYEPVPDIDRDVCLGWRSCSLCVPACPAHAIAPSDRYVEVDRTDCVGCGVCVSTCPAGAVTFPGSSLAEYEAALDVLLSAPQQPIAFACRRALDSHERVEEPESEPGWRCLRLPCLGTVTTGWILQTLAAGAPAVKLISCGADCRADRWSSLRSRVDYVERLLAELGEDDPARRVRIVTEAGEREGGKAPSARGYAGAHHTVTLAEPQASAEALPLLQSLYGAEGSIRLSHPESPIGLIDLRVETCTTCGTCGEVCPTGALDVSDGALSREISFDPRRCLACGRCAAFCPEAAFDTLTVQSATHTDELARGRRTLASSAHMPCARCGRPIAPSAMLDRIGVMLEGSNGSDELLRILRRLCSDCRGLMRDAPGVES